ncbi:hypothetical protein [Parashewanella tropica]|uniref:hypothetical protein n=1 Tax=Parashewanella tropica TaxID=2547970 RepID=UPI00105A261F|nr:hypothetical protein [Parashewanella tropica]
MIISIQDISSLGQESYEAYIKQSRGGQLPSNKKVDVVIGETHYRMEESKFLDSYNVAGIHRIPQADFETIPQCQKLRAGMSQFLSADDRGFSRFNLKQNNTKVGQLYLALPIIRGGRDGQGQDYIPPLLCLNGALVYRAERVECELDYQTITHYFESRQLVPEQCIECINDADSLQRTLIARYTVSRPNSTPQTIIDDGVAVVWMTLQGFYSKDGSKYTEIK